jgi:predicted DNA-binding WGR domain protein
MTRRFECVEDGAAKFWEVSIEGAAMTVRFGKKGTNGQSKTKDLGSAEAAAKEAESLIKEKTKKGYVEIGGASAPAAAPAAVPPPAAAAPVAPAPAAPVVRAVPPGPLFSKLYTEGAHRHVAWSGASAELRRRVDPDLQNVVAMLVRGWRIEVRSKEEAEALFARVLALPSEAPKEPSAVLAWPGWDLDVGSRTKWLAFGAILLGRSSDSGPQSQLAGAQGPGAAPLSALEARLAWAEEWIGDAFRPAFPEAAGAPSTYLCVGGGTGDAWLALGALGSKIAGLPFSRRTADANGKKHRDGLAGVELAHASWDEDACVEVDVSEAGLAAARTRIGAAIAEPRLLIAASYDSRS